MEYDSVENFAKLISKALEEYADGVEELVERAIDEVSKDTLNDLKNNPVIPERTGDYAKGFYLKNIYKGKSKEKGVYKVVVANKVYRVGHLLENGHLTRNGGRTKAYPHWKHAQEVANTLPDKIKEVLS